ncbi:MAG TPA: DUF5674 family protein [Anaerolineaceae bacterium]
MLQDRASLAQISSMLEEHQDYIKVVVDIRREFMACGGANHAELKDILLAGGSIETDLWGAVWYPVHREVVFRSQINSRGDNGDQSEIQKPVIRHKVKQLIERFL